jgi:hypothetical protein
MTEAVYEFVPVAKVGVRVPLEIVSADNFALVPIYVNRAAVRS